MSSRPAILAVDDDLERVESAASGDPATAVAGARDRLAEFEARSAGAQVSLLDDAEELLLRAEEQLEGDPARTVAAVRNRLRIYRQAVSRTGEDLAVIDSTLRTETEEEATVTTLRGETAELVATVVNGGRDREVVLVVGFYDDDGEGVEEVASDPISFAANEQAPVDLEVVVPEAARYYAVSALDAETETVG